MEVLIDDRQFNVSQEDLNALRKGDRKIFENIFSAYYERLTRLAEVYLLLAECKLRGSVNEAEAIALMDEVRKYHVGMNAGDFDGVADLIAKYPERFSSPLDVLWYERRVELAGEGDRWFDLVRSGRAASVMGAIYPGVDWNKHIYMPIGLIEQGNSGNTLTAYPDEVYPDPIE